MAEKETAVAVCDTDARERIATLAELEKRLDFRVKTLEAAVKRLTEKVFPEPSQSAPAPVEEDLGRFRRPTGWPFRKGGSVEWRPRDLAQRAKGEADAILMANYGYDRDGRLMRGEDLEAAHLLVDQIKGWTAEEVSEPYAAVDRAFACYGVLAGLWPIRLKAGQPAPVDFAKYQNATDGRSAIQVYLDDTEDVE